MAEKLKKRSVDDINMDLEAVMRVMEHLMKDYEKFHAEREEAMKVYYAEVFGNKTKVTAKVR